MRSDRLFGTELDTEELDFSGETLVLSLIEYDDYYLVELSSEDGDNIYYEREWDEEYHARGDFHRVFLDPARFV